VAKASAERNLSRTVDQAIASTVKLLKGQMSKNKYDNFFDLAPVLEGLAGIGSFPFSDPSGASLTPVCLHSGSHAFSDPRTLLRSFAIC